MTPADRDEVRALADRALDHQDHMSECPCGACKVARAVLRYVPPGDAESPLPFRVDHDGCGMVAIAFDASVVAMEPDVAHRLANAIHAAADAAEES